MTEGSFSARAKTSLYFSTCAATLSWLAGIRTATSHSNEDSAPSTFVCLTVTSICLYSSVLKKSQQQKPESAKVLDFMAAVSLATATYLSNPNANTKAQIRDYVFIFLSVILMLFLSVYTQSKKIHLVRLAAGLQSTAAARALAWALDTSPIEAALPANEAVYMVESNCRVYVATAASSTLLASCISILPQNTNFKQLETINALFLILLWTLAFFSSVEADLKYKESSDPTTDALFDREAKLGTYMVPSGFLFVSTCGFFFWHRLQF